MESLMGRNGNGIPLAVVPGSALRRRALMFTNGAKERWVQAQPEYIVARGKVQAMERARVRYPQVSMHESDLSWLAAALDAERNAIAELDAAKAEPRKIRHRLETEFDETRSGRTGG
jgi:hypothetical protein